MLRQLCRRNLGLKQWYHSSAIRLAPPPRPRYVRFSSPNPNFNGGNSNKGNFFNDRTWPIKVGVGMAGLGVIYYVSCLEQVQETGRWRFISVSPQYEAEIGKVALKETINEFGPKILPPNHPISMHVKRVVQNVLDASGLGIVKGYTQHPQLQSNLDFVSDDWKNTDTLASPPHSAIASPNREWEVLVVNDRKIVNAAATPGTIIVFTGILPICKDEKGLAAVLSHEIGHVVARHTAERLSSQTVFMALGLFLALFGVDFGISAIINKMLLELPNSRLQEREADLIGLRLMSKACYDPKASPEMFARLGQLETKASRGMGMRAPEFFNTHPSSESRVRDLEARLGEGYDILAANPQCAALYDQVHAFRENANMKSVNVFEHMKDEWL
ncbi:hypothetical protein BT96DRAFT_812719 [Gymnopus androsaceus JB14]|uniref:Peptidase M48 domain-containing protein n=1 Tax=Gymnopus androsaceus JB14 TaxID=1447944 RepID=A0A6A4I764_9AGAR|nr:hypothetical protein BT96DRAFT_812719 [Gymnopus androsaceus JB14]